MKAFNTVSCPAVFTAFFTVCATVSKKPGYTAGAPDFYGRNLIIPAARCSPVLRVIFRIRRFIEISGSAVTTVYV
jgi:hypothetical protein